MDYKILTSGDSDSLEKTVKEWIGKGYKPTGGVTIIERPIGSDRIWFYQAIYKPVKEPNINTLVIPSNNLTVIKYEVHKLTGENCVVTDVLVTDEGALIFYKKVD